jgi:Flp pilus assembly protein TadD
LTRDFIDLVEAYTNLEQRTPGGLTRAIQLFDSILSRNAADCAALAGSAQLLLICHHYSEAPASECWNQALARSRSAVQLEARSPEANVALAYATVLGKRDFKEGERLFHFALSLNPENHRAHHWLCNLLSMCGRTDDALSHAEAALKLKPDSPIVWKIQGDPLYYAGRFDEAIARYSSAIENRANWTAYVYRGLALAQRRWLGDVELAVRDLKKAARMNPGAQHEIDGAYGFLCAVIGDRSGAESVLSQLLTDARPGSPLSVAAIYAGLGDLARAFEWVEKALADPHESLFWLGVDPRFGNLRADPRYAEIVTRLGLPQNHLPYVP